jgi:hypothetical protein
MKQRSSLELCLPFVVFAAACALSVTTLVIAIVWLTLGVCSIGHRSLESFPAEGIPKSWLYGDRRVGLWFYHLARWPVYMKTELQALAAWASSLAGVSRRSSHSGKP